MKKLILIAIVLLMSGCVFGMNPSMDDEQEVSRLVDEGILHMREGDLDRAKANFELAGDLTVSAAAVDGLGCIAFLQEDYALAEELFWQAYETDSTYNNSLGNLALLFEKQGRKAEAEKLFAQAMREDPKNFRMRNNYAAYLGDNKGPKERAFSELYKAQALFNHPMIYDNINILKEN